MSHPNRIKMPPAFYEMTVEAIKILSEADGEPRCHVSQWDTLSEADKDFYRLKAYWTAKGASYPGAAAAIQTVAEAAIDPEWDAECRARGWRVWHPTTYEELEREFLPPPVPNIDLIMERCPQMATLRRLRGDVSEPYWWAGLSITEHAEPNLSKECSDGYAGFSEAELEYRQTRIKQEGTKPARCSRLSEVNPGGCSSCRFNGQINSPIALGFKHEPKGGNHG